MGRRLKCDFAKDLVISGTDLQKISLVRYKFFWCCRIISRVFSNLEVHVCNFGCRCRPIQDGRVTRVNFSAFPCLAFFGKLLYRLLHCLDFLSHIILILKARIGYTRNLGFRQVRCVPSTLKNHQNGPKLGENGNINLLNFHSTQFLVSFPEPKTRIQLTDTSLLGCVQL